MPKIVRVTPRDDHTLMLELDNHHCIIFNLRPRLKSVRFCGLAALAKFKTVRVEHENTLIWDKNCQITIDEIISMLDR